MRGWCDSGTPGCDGLEVQGRVPSTPSVCTSECRRLSLRAFTLLIPLVLAATSARAWNLVGHEVIARAAWSELPVGIQQEAVRLLDSTPESIRLRTLRPSQHSRGGQILFERAATWPDLVRSEVPSESRPGWHYTNFFWSQDRSGVTDLHPAPENILTQLPVLLRVLGDRSQPDEERGVALAWILHLVGDLHQPLHCSARVSTLDPKGDRGGNDFKLEGPVPGLEDWRRDNLHSLWDSALTRTSPQSFVESDWRYRQRLVQELRSSERSQSTATTAETPVWFTAFTLAEADRQFQQWATESFELAKSRCYPPTLIRDQPARAPYLEMAARESIGRMDLAARRLAAVLEGSLAYAKSADAATK